jgi:hypothetical protein
MCCDPLVDRFLRESAGLASLGVIENLFESLCLALGVDVLLLISLYHQEFHELLLF